MIIKLLVIGSLLAVTVSCFDAAPDRVEEPAFKGMELYSWKPDAQDWHFSLLVGTNRLKSDNEIKKPEHTVVGLEELKKRVAQLAEGETVFWHNLAKGAVPEEIAKDLQTFCDNIKVKLVRI